MKRSKKLILATVILLVCGSSAVQSQVTGRKLKTEQILQFFRDVRVAETTENSFTLAFATVEPAQVHVWIDMMEDMPPADWRIVNGTYSADEVVGVTVEERKENHRVTLRRILYGFRPGITRSYTIKASTEDGRTYEYHDTFVVPERPTPLTAETKPLGTIAEKFVVDLKVSASRNSVWFTFNTLEPASVKIVTRNKPFREEPPPESPAEQSARPPRYIPDFGFPKLSGVGETEVVDRRMAHSVTVDVASAMTNETTYYYLIAATTEAGRIHKYSGTFQRVAEPQRAPPPAATKRRKIP